MDDKKAFLASPVRCLEAEEGGEGVKKRGFAVLAYTGAPVGTLFGRMVIDLSGMTAAERFPVLREHERDRIVGVAESWSLSDEGFALEGFFSAETDDAREVLRLADEGYPWQASIGVWATEIETLKRGEKAVCNGVEYQGPIEIWRGSNVREVSFVTLGADANTSAAVFSAQDRENINIQQEEVEMEKMELAAAEEQTEELAAKAVDSEAIRAEAVLAERKRASEIDSLCGKFGLASLAAELKEGGCTMEQAREKVLERLSAENPRVGRIETGASAGERFRAAASDGVMLRLDPRWGQGRTLAEGAEGFRHMGLQAIARECLSQSGVRNVARLSNVAVADMLLSRRARLDASTEQTTADFNGIFKDVLNKRLIAAFEREPRTWEPLVNIVSADDFKYQYGVELSGGPDLAAVSEGEEYTVGTLSDSTEKFQIAKYGKIIQLTWEMLVNDDLSAFGRLPQMFGTMAARKINDVVWGLITSNPTLSDSKDVFCADHGNLTAFENLNAAALDGAYQAMMAQTGLAGERTPFQPRYLCVAPSQRTAALVLLDTPLLYASDTTGAGINVWKNSGIVPIVEPRLTASAGDPQPWYLFADPAAAQTIDVAFLDGRQAPEVMEHDDFSVDAISYKVRVAMGAGWMNYRGAVMNVYEEEDLGGGEGGGEGDGGEGGGGEGDGGEGDGGENL